MRLIDADELYKEIYHVYEYENPTASGAFDEFVSRTLKNIIYNTPTVEAEPVRHGKWEGYHGEKFCKDGEYRHYHFYVCSNCGRRTAVKTNFCPDCGCRMDGD